MRFLRLVDMVRVVVVAAVVGSFAGSAGAVTYGSSVYATGLLGPRGLAFDAGGTLYVAETGAVPTGQSGLFNVGSISRIVNGTRQQVVAGLPTYRNPVTGEVAGPQDVAFGANGVGYVVTGFGADPATRPANSGLGSVLTFTGGGFAPFADVAALGGTTNPLPHLPDSNPFHLAVAGNGLLATDAGGNALFAIAADGTVTTRALFPPHQVGPNPFADSVPTGVAVAPDGTVYVAELTGGPFTPGAARIYKLGPPDATGLSVADTFATGLTELTDLAFGADGYLYGLEYDLNGLIVPGTGGALVRIAPDGSSFERIFSDGLDNPTGLAVGPDGAFYVAINSPGGPGGQVLRIATIPEPAAWVLMVGGFGLVGSALRRGREVPVHLV